MPADVVKRVRFVVRIASDNDALARNLTQEVIAGI